MKRLLALIVLAALVGAVGATSLNFQNPVDNTSITNYKVGSPSINTVQWVESTNGLNNYVQVNCKGAYTFCGFGLPSSSLTTYAAADMIYWNGAYRGSPGVVLYSSTGTVLWNAPVGYDMTGVGKWEVKVNGGTAYIFLNGVQKYNSTPLAQDPGYIAFGVKQVVAGSYGIDEGIAYWDNYVYGQTENKVVLGLPESDNDAFIILQDITNSANDGLFNTTSQNQANANYMQGQWSRGNTSLSPETLPNESIQLVNYATGAVYATNYTGTAYSGTVTIDIKSLLLDTNAPDGYYAMYMPGTGAYSNVIVKKSNGASVQWNQDEYSVGDTGTVIYYVLDGGYWDTSSFSYKVSILDSYMNFKQNTFLTASSGSVTYDWTENDAEGVYHAWLIATNHDGYEYLLGSDYAELVAYFGYGGYVNDCVTELPLPDANVNVTQGMTALYNGTSGVNGNYTTGPLYSTGSNVFFNVTKANYNPYQYNFVPLSSGTVNDLNLTICPTAGSGETGGIGIGGVIRDATIGRPIQGANVSLTNVTNSQQYFKLTNMAGGYLCDAGTLCTLPTGRLYMVNASKVGYNTSTDYPVVAGSA